MPLTTVRVTILGERPLLWHAFTPEALSGARRERGGTAGNDPAEWRRTVLVTPDGLLYLRPQQVFACLREAARYTKAGRGTLQNSVAATLQVVEHQVVSDLVLPAEPPTDLDAPVFLDAQGVRNPTTKARNVRYRIGAAPGWRLSFTLRWDKTIVSAGQLESVLRDAGALVGLGNGRSIGYGRFVVESFEVAT